MEAGPSAGVHEVAVLDSRADRRRTADAHKCMPSFDVSALRSTSVDVNLGSSKIRLEFGGRANWVPDVG